MRSLALIAGFAMSMLLLGSSGAVAYAAPQTETNLVSKNVTIQPGDSLSSIATANQSSTQRMYDANTSIDNPNLIFPGKELRVPAKDETLATRPMPEAVAPVAEAPVAAPEPTQVAEPTSAATPAPQATSAPSVANGSVWDQLAQCEAGGNWSINTGNGFYGGLQFTVSSWQAAGGSGLPSNASREEQIMRGQTLQSMQGWGAWPACSAKLGLR